MLEWEVGSRVAYKNIVRLDRQIEEEGSSKLMMICISII